MSKGYYNRKQKYSYCFGVYPVLELLKKRPQDVIQIFINPKGGINKGVEEIKHLCSKLKIGLGYDERFLAKAGEKENIYAGAQFSKYESVLRPGEIHLVLVHPENMGNLGTIIRTAHAFNCKNVCLIRPAADIFDPKVIRASMGSVFSINFEYLESLTEYTKKYTNNLYIFTPKNGGDIAEIDAMNTKTPALVFGSESSGLSNTDLSMGKNITIKFSSDVDSLNLSVAAGIALHHFYR